MLAFPMVYLLIAVSLDRLGPDLALGRLPPEWVKKSARRGGWRRGSRNNQLGLRRAATISWRWTTERLGPRRAATISRRWATERLGLQTAELIKVDH